MMAGSGMGSFGGQNVMQLMQNDRGSSNALAAMLVSCNAHVGFQAPRTGLGHGLDDMAMHHACGQKRAFYPAFDGSGGALEEMEDDVYGDVDLAHSGGSVEKKRRLSFDQVRSLERSFEVENKLEPERKMQLARELNLQPRQVAVWFQNRRARWKIKQLERDYEMLNSSYTKLKVDLDSTLREKDSLKAEVQRLSGKPVSTESAQCTSEAPPRKATKPAPTIEVSGSRKKKVVVATSHSGSNESSSELLDSDSPRTVDSNQRQQQQQQQQQEASENHQQALVPSDINLLDGGPSCVDVKRELGTTTGFQADAYFLQPVQPEQGAALPWWDQWA